MPWAVSGMPHRDEGRMEHDSIFILDKLLWIAGSGEKEETIREEIAAVPFKLSFLGEASDFGA